MHTGRALIKLQREKGVGSSELARLIGVSRQQVARWRQQHSIRTHTLVRIAEALDVSIEEFLEAAQ